jgi:hypothetical protein
MKRVGIERAAAALRQKARALERELRTAETANAREALAIARGLSSGPLSQHQLTRMGHPYARRSPRPPFSAAIINLQTGLFRALWRVRGVESTGSGIRSVLANDAPYARYLGERGTSRTIGRPIVRAIAQRVRFLRERRLAAAVRAGLKV